MLEAFAAGDVGEGEEEVVLVVVVRLVEGVGFADEVGDLGEQGGTEVRVVGGVGDDVDEVGGLDSGARGNSWKYWPVMTGESSSCSTLVRRSGGLTVTAGAVGLSARVVLGRLWG